MQSITTKLLMHSPVTNRKLTDNVEISLVITLRVAVCDISSQNFSIPSNNASTKLLPGLRGHNIKSRN